MIPFVLRWQERAYQPACMGELRWTCNGPARRWDRARWAGLGRLRRADRHPDRSLPPPSPVSWSAGVPHHEVTDVMLKRLTIVVVLALSGLLAACNTPSSPGTSPGGASPSAPADSPGASPEDSASPEAS
jgi:hypothetical protein